MSARLTRVSIPLLRWTLGVVVLLESAQFVFSNSAAHFFAKTGLPAWLRPALGGAEIIAAVLFLVPFTTLIGAVLVCMAHPENRTAEANLERS